ncbi:MAG: hypothetical protein HY870_10750 [Chloroflexi bacterium]|nr:hypothetical protein [Chloroflexota bacterium]
MTTHAEPNSMKRLYLARLRAAQICPASDWPYGQAVYYDPGSVSLSSDETLSYCFMEFGSDLQPWVWSQAQARLSPILTRRAVNLVEQERRRLESVLPADWEGAWLIGQRAAALDVCRLLYFEPEHSYLKPMWQLLNEHRTLTPKQIATVQQIKAERGGLQGLRHRQVIQWRLMRLSELDLKPNDAATVREFQPEAQTPLGLKRTREAVITALEMNYVAQRLSQTRQRAIRIWIELKQAVNR